MIEPIRFSEEELKRRRGDMTFPYVDANGFSDATKSNLNTVIANILTKRRKDGKGDQDEKS